MRELPLVGANRVPPVIGSWCAPLTPDFRCPSTGAASSDGAELSEEWILGGQAPQEAQEPEGTPDIEQVPHQAEEPEGASSEVGSDSSESSGDEQKEEEEERTLDELTSIFLVNNRSGCFHAMVACDVGDKGAMSCTSAPLAGKIHPSGRSVSSAPSASKLAG